ncbi:hypothetical protein [Jannaschia rubra]|uniref:Uncharacterized protein n=1 Tax=Jannaschia rubra TaxID=282197 RepID=A0A0M6XS59_9RHOB|nr:hypothetical protein [Jannaschia rubra]CTQ33979.1 hypothetical protein JAN5088_02768 [Jannaschia rubra]SFG25986.1 hypothetical protein SAMN04488517_103370 [Jannaschia rubra]
MASRPHLSISDLTTIRFAALTCRASARRVPSGDPAVAMLATALRGLGRPPCVYAPGTEAVSFDEHWMLALLAAIRRGDRSSRTFLLRSRIRTAEREMLDASARVLAAQLDAAVA